GAFPYSEVPGATANALPKHVPEELKQERYKRLMELQQTISFQKNQGKVGQTLEVLIDDYGELPGDIIGRSKADAPGIDGNVYALSDGTVKIGDIVTVRVNKADVYDLHGEVVANVPWKPNVLTLK
ncbi:MAG: TRAM domain-containing protein, partial [Trueperaceae bacterium]